MESLEVHLQSSRFSLLSVLLVVIILGFCGASTVDGQNWTAEIDVGMIVNMETVVGKMSQSCMSMALTDFYATHSNYSTRIKLHTRDAQSDTVAAASAAIDLLKNVQVQAILGPQRSTQAEFVIEIGTKSQVPIISQATSPFLSPKTSPFFIRAAHNASSQAEAIAALVKAFGWNEVVFIYEGSGYGSGVGPYLSEALQKSNAKVSHRRVLSPLASDDQILQELYRLMTMQTRVFVVDMLPTDLASRFFLKVKDAGMMEKGYAWIITDLLTNLLDTLDASVIESMQGVLGLKPYVPQSIELGNFTKRWRKRFRQENLDVDRIELNVYSLWAYDSVTALAMAVERVGVAQPKFKRPDSGENLTDLAAIGTLEMGQQLLESIQKTRFKGLSGDFHLVDGQLQSSAFQIVNINGRGEREIGFWTRRYGISKNLEMPKNRNYTTDKDDLRVIIWPGDSNMVPRGWDVPTGEKKLRVGVPIKGGFVEFVRVENPLTNAMKPTGFCIDVFEEVMKSLPYAVPYEYIPFGDPKGESAVDYDEFVYQVFLEKFDAVVGDITIVENRSKYVDFTLPFTESGVGMIVPMESDDRKNAWIFMKPLRTELWITIGTFFIYTGFVVWVLEHRVNKEFRGPRHKQVGMIFWFSFSTLVFAHKEKITSNLTRFVVIVWVFVVLVLTSSYTANLTSMLTLQQLQPTIKNMNDLMRNGEYIGYQNGSFVAGLLKKREFDESKFKAYSTFEEYDEALRKGSKNGGVAAIVDELPYIRLFLAKYCSKYTMVGPSYQTAGLGFAFPRGSPLLPDVSRAILRVTEADTIRRISDKWLGEEAVCPEKDGAINNTCDSLTLDSFKGLFLIAGTCSSAALIMFLLIFLHENRDILDSNDSIWEKLVALARTFDVEKKNSSEESKKKQNETIDADDAIPEDFILAAMQSPAVSICHNQDGIFSPEDGFSATEPGTPNHQTFDTITVEHTTDQER